ncbi:MAG: OmpA family protein [Treponema sp.]|nr:OmpA family protein [Treponema sp.]
MASGEIFEYRHVKGSRYRILSVVDQSVFINGILSHRAETLNRISVDVTDVDNDKGIHKAVFQTSERLLYSAVQRTQSASGFSWTREYDSVFERDKLGHLTIDPQYFMPVVRNVPVFPGRDLQVGDTWYADAHEVHDFREAFGIKEPYRIPFNAFYEFLGRREWKGVWYPAFSVNYNIDSRPPRVAGSLYPVRITGRFSQIVFWDHSIGQETAYEEDFRIIFEMSNGTIIEFRGKAYAEFIEAEEMNKEQLVEEIIEEIKRLDIHDVSVTAVDEGISLSLDDIRFYPDLNRMLPGEEIKLHRIADILKRYPDRDILVSGHTALAGTTEQRMTLSEQRARTIADYLIKENVRSADRIVIRGFGAERPVADNSTDEGMRRNRRVEITLLEN